MKEFSPDELAKLLINKVKELKAEKKQSEELNEKLEEHVVQLEETTAKLEETQEELKKQRDSLAEEVKKKTKELVKKERTSAIGEMSARISHDMRNPLNVIKNSVEILKLASEKNMDVKTRMHWDRLERAIYRITHQVEDVLDYVKVPKLSRRNSSLSLILQDSMERISIPKGFSIKLPKKDFDIYCDPVKLEIVFVNLIMNAIQATHSKGGTLIINAMDHPANNKFVLIEVTDSGPSIPTKLITKVFDPLFTTRQIGTGLGLPSCKSIIENHGGTISVQSPKGKGATFMIKLPKKSEWEKISTIHEKEQLSQFIAETSLSS